jgi:RNA polymerase sigma-70 factor (ECF subfamily)
MSLAIDWLRRPPGEDPSKYLDDVFRYAMSRLNQREDAEDIAIEVVQALPNPCSRRDLKLYMIGMARRKVADRLRTRKTSSLRDEADPDRFDAQSNLAADVSRTMIQLSDLHREVLTLKYIAGLSSREIASILDKSPEAIDSLLQRARQEFAAI